MSKISFRAIPRKFNNGSYLLLPATQLDRNCLNQFSANVGSHYLTVTVNYARGNKSYDQVKTIFALINIRFSLQHHRQPTDKEQAMVYSSFLWKYADKVPNPINPEEEVPVSLSEMDKGQAASFIGSIIADIYEYAGNTLTDTQQVELKEIFEEFQTVNFQGIGNPVDYDKDGNLLSEEEWRVKNHFSFASGVASEDLQLHHILTRSSKPQLTGVAWNWIMLTEEEHMRIIHAKGGWQKFIEIFPHCAKRIKNAYDMAHEMYPHEIQTAFIRLGLINEYSEEIKEESSEAEDLATQALKAAEGNFNGDIF